MLMSIRKRTHHDRQLCLPVMLLSVVFCGCIATRKSDEKQALAELKSTFGVWVDALARDRRVDKLALNHQDTNRLIKLWTETGLIEASERKRLQHDPWGNAFRLAVTVDQEKTVFRVYSQGPESGESTAMGMDLSVVITFIKGDDSPRVLYSQAFKVFRY